MSDTRVYKEILIYAIVAASSLLLMTFVVHMLVGGLVSPETEQKLTFGLCGLVACLIGAMAWDVVRRRKQPRKEQRHKGASTENDRSE